MIKAFKFLIFVNRWNGKSNDDEVETMMQDLTETQCQVQNLTFSLTLQVIIVLYHLPKQKCHDAIHYNNGKGITISKPLEIAALGIYT